MEDLITEETHSTWKTKLRAMGKGKKKASAAVGGAHIVSSAQEGERQGRKGREAGREETNTKKER